jgi:uncharacterized membrane-anchored protein YitT (DUF2179 family)
MEKNETLTIYRHRYNWLRKLIVAVIYGLFSAIGINLFLSSAHSYSIGIPGIAQLLHGLLALNQINLSIAGLVVLLNIPMVIISLIIFGWDYTIFSVVAVISNVAFLKIIPEEKLISEQITNTLVGGVIIGIGIGLCFRNGFSTGGTDVIVSFVQQRFRKNIGFVNIIINGFILGVTAIFFGISGAIYSLLGMVVTSYMMDKIYIQQSDVMLIIFTKKSAMLANHLRQYTHGATVFNGRGIYKNQETDMVITIIQKSEISFFKDLILKIDKKAFISVQTTDLLNGNYIRNFY